MAVKGDVEKSQKHKEVIDKGPKFGIRHVQLILIFWLLCIGYTTRFNLSIAIVAMTDSNSTSNPDIPTYDWDDASVILSSFSWGYVSCQLLAAYVAKRYGSRWFLMIAVFINATSGALTPIVADQLGSIGVIILRIIQGMSQGFFYPSTNTFLGKWAPAEERSWIGTVAMSGAAVGSVVATLVTGVISASWYGWPASFYLYSVCGYLWCILWFYYGFSSPNSHPRISPEEKRYIQTSLDQQDHQEKLPVPWKAIFKSKAHWVTIIALVGGSWGTTTLSTEVPTYLNKVLKFDMTSNSFISAAPSALSIPIGLVCARIADYMIVKRNWSRLTVRKIFQAIGGLPSAIALVFLSFLPDGHPVLVIVLINLSQALYGATNCGCAIIQVDMSPTFSGILLGISSTLAQLFSMFAPLMVQFVVTDTTDTSLWRIVFLTSAVVFAVSTLIFVFFASADRQWWDSATTKPGTTVHNPDKRYSVLSLALAVNEFPRLSDNL